MPRPFLCKKRTTLSTGTRTKNEICQACNNKLVQNNQSVLFDETTGQVKIIEAQQPGELKLEKNVDSIARYFGGFEPKHAALWRDAINSMVVSMRDEEEILLGFRGAIIYKNRGQEQITDYIGIITNKRFYYAGMDMVFGYVQFEVKNEDYKLTFNSMMTNGQVIREKLEEAIRACESTDAAPVVVQNALSAADELKKFKEPLDMGVITQDEFDAKKKQLLGL